MRNRERHRDKFLREFDIEELHREMGQPKRRVEERWWCTREGAKEVIDDLSDKEFEIIVDVLTQLFVMNERFPTSSFHRRLRRRITRFIQGKTIEKVGWDGWPDETPLPYLGFTDGTYFEIIRLITVPGTVLYNWGREDAENR